MLTRLPRRINWQLDVRTLLRACGYASAVLYFAITLASLGRAWTVDGGVRDRRAELVRLEHRLAEARSRTEQLRSQNEAFERDAEVRMGVIRRELGLLRAEERFMVFK